MKKILIIDNYDSFVYNIYQYLGTFNIDTDMRANDKLNDIGEYDGYIISPGPGNPKNIDDRGSLFEFIDNHKSSKFLGICFGNQLLGYYLGSDIAISKRLMHGELDTIKHTNSLIYRNIPEEFTAIRYHSLVITENKNIIVDAYSKSDGEIMGFHSMDNRIFGVQYHPESYYSSYGKSILKNFVDAL
ncbi:MAG: aminodeoxychorismate/anthranilate synthase component II [Ferroplasma sp.]